MLSCILYLFYGVKCFHIVAHAQLVTFSKKEVVLNLPTFLISIIRGIYTKLLTFLKSSVKTNVTSGWTFFVVFLTFVFKEICMETRMCNIFKSTDVMKLTKTILESIYKVLQSWWKRKTNGQYNFQKPFNPRIIFVEIFMSFFWPWPI